MAEKLQKSESYEMQLNALSKEKESLQKTNQVNNSLIYSSILESNTELNVKLYKFILIFII